MRTLSLALRYFAIVFAAGFALAMVRLPYLVPRYGTRTAELMETPVMLLVIGAASFWIQRRNPRLSGPSLLAVGSLAFLLMLLAELGVMLATSDQTLVNYVASRDPVSGTVYLASLMVFALAPWLWSLYRRRRK